MLMNGTLLISMNFSSLGDHLKPGILDFYRLATQPDLKVDQNNIFKKNNSNTCLTWNLKCLEL